MSPALSDSYAWPTFAQRQQQPQQQHQQTMQQRRPLKRTASDTTDDDDSSSDDSHAKRHKRPRRLHRYTQQHLSPPPSIPLQASPGPRPFPPPLYRASSSPPPVRPSLKRPREECQTIEDSMDGLIIDIDTLQPLGKRTRTDNFPVPPRTGATLGIPQPTTVSVSSSGQHTMALVPYDTRRTPSDPSLDLRQPEPHQQQQQTLHLDDLLVERLQGGPDWRRSFPTQRIPAGRGQMVVYTGGKWLPPSVLPLGADFEGHGDHVEEDDNYADDEGGQSGDTTISEMSMSDEEDGLVKEVERMDLD
ncbi:hypothetical protein HKX48_006638 [Thoreauomyces humboldtii]|nr:hypothetical protein HKX48_006638 [Thoreauomyces humboldtii]